MSGKRGSGKLGAGSLWDGSLFNRPVSDEREANTYHIKNIKDYGLYLFISHINKYNLLYGGLFRGLKSSDLNVKRGSI